ncbi:MAG: ABC transporter ATP-binding protein [Egibacteraceae bacterium]
MAEPASAATEAVGEGLGEDPVLACDGLRKSFGDLTAVDGISFAIAHGEAYGLLGPNGAGKTTVISMLCGLLVPDGGTVTVAGHSVTADARHAKAAIGYVPQDVALFPDLTARENLAFFGRLYGLRGAPLRDRVESTLAVVGLTDRGGDRVETYSGGMKRRVNIAAGLLHEPQLVVLDEPTVGVDPQSRNAILESVAALSGAGTAILYTSHYMEEVERLCDRVGIIDSGRMVAEGTRRQLVSRLGQRDRVELVVDGDAAGVARACERLEGVHEAITTDQAVTLLVTNGRGLLADVMGAAAASGSTVTSVEVIEPDLEAVFLHLTGKALRD